MSTGYVIPIDPANLSRFVYYDPREEEDDEDELSEAERNAEIEELKYLLDQQGNRERLRPLLDRIPEREADIIELYFLLGKRQADIATIFAMTQAAVSYRLARGIKRIRFLLDIPEVTREQMLADLSEIFLSEEGKPHIDVLILVNMWLTTCQSEVATRLNLTQGRVRHRFFKAVERLKEASKVHLKFEPYSQIFGKISSKNFNVLREVKLPQWGNRGGDECL